MRVNGDVRNSGVHEDAELVVQARAGNAAAFGELWRRHYPLTVAVLRPLVHGDAEDVASEAFAKVWVQLRKGEGPETHFKAYVICAAKRLAYRVSSRKQRYAAEFAEEHLAAAHAADPYEEVEVRERLSAAFTSIPERWAQLLWLLAIEQRTRSEVREMLGLSPQALSSATYRARSRFREAYAPAEM